MENRGLATSGTTVCAAGFYSKDPEDRVCRLYNLSPWRYKPPKINSNSSGSREETPRSRTKEVSNKFSPERSAGHLPKTGGKIGEVAYFNRAAEI